MPEGKAPHFPQQPVARQNEDGSLELECFLEASPVPDIKWFYDQTVSVRVDRYHYLLYLQELKQEGRFSFRLDNKGSEAFSAILQIKVCGATDIRLIIFLVFVGFGRC